MFFPRSARNWLTSVDTVCGIISVLKEPRQRPENHGTKNRRFCGKELRSRGRSQDCPITRVGSTGASRFLLLKFVLSDHRVAKSEICQVHGAREACRRSAVLATGPYIPEVTVLDQGKSATAWNRAALPSGQRDSPSESKQLPPSQLLLALWSGAFRFLLLLLQICLDCLANERRNRRSGLVPKSLKLLLLVFREPDGGALH